MIYRGVLFSRQKNTCHLVYRLTSAGPPPATPSKPGSLSYRYEKFISQWPKIQKIHRMVVDGSRWCFSDIKTYYKAKKSLGSGKHLCELSFPELETLVQTPAEGPKLAIVLTLLPLPFTVYIIGFAMIFFPRFVLTRHFWTDTQRKDFFLKEVLNSMEIASKPQNIFSKSLESSSNLSVENTSFNDTITLSRFHGYLPIPFNLNNRLKDRAKFLKQLDSMLHSKLDELTPQQLYFHMYIRRLTYNGLSDADIKAKLKKWLTFSSNLTEVNYLMASFYLNK